MKSHLFPNFFFKAFLGKVFLFYLVIICHIYLNSGLTFPSSLSHLL